MSWGVGLTGGFDGKAGAFGDAEQNILIPGSRYGDGSIAEVFDGCRSRDGGVLVGEFRVWDMFSGNGSVETWRALRFRVASGSCDWMNIPECVAYLTAT